MVVTNQTCCEHAGWEVASSLFNWFQPHRHVWTLFRVLPRYWSAQENASRSVAAPLERCMQWNRLSWMNMPVRTPKKGFWQWMAPPCWPRLIQVNPWKWSSLGNEQGSILHGKETHPGIVLNIIEVPIAHYKALWELVRNQSLPPAGIRKMKRRRLHPLLFMGIAALSPSSSFMRGIQSMLRLAANARFISILAEFCTM